MILPSLRIRAFSSAEASSSRTRSTKSRVSACPTRSQIRSHCSRLAVGQVTAMSRSARGAASPRARDPKRWIRSISGIDFRQATICSSGVTADAHPGFNARRCPTRISGASVRLQPKPAKANGNKGVFQNSAPARLIARQYVAARMENPGAPFSAQTKTGQVLSRAGFLRFPSNGKIERNHGE